MSVSVVFCSFALYTDRRISLFQRYVMFMTDRKGSRWMILLVLNYFGSFRKFGLGGKGKGRVSYFSTFCYACHPALEDQKASFQATQSGCSKRPLPRHKRSASLLIAKTPFTTWNKEKSSGPAQDTLSARCRSNSNGLQSMTT